MAAAAKPRLTYFDARGRAEIIRLIFAEAGVEFDDVRFRPSLNALEDFQAFKQNNEVPFDQVPILEIEGMVLAQSQAIIRYIARKYGLTGASEEENALCDMISCGTEDLRQKLTNVIFLNCEKARDQQMKAFQEEVLPQWAAFFERLLKKNGGEWFVGKKLTYSDLAVYDCLSTIRLRVPGCLGKEFETLRAHHARVESLPNIAEWLRTRPDNSV